MITAQRTQLLAGHISYWPPAGKFHVILSWLQQKKETSLQWPKQNNFFTGRRSIP
jgi:hypothetical protein